MPFCSSCGKEISEDTKFCPQCGKPLTDTHGEQVATSALYKEVSERELGKRTSWFEKHLNWTMVLAWFSTYAIAFVVGSIVTLADPDVSEEALSTMGIVVGFLAPIPVAVWVIRKKNRSMWWLLISWSYFFLLLSNKSLPQVKDM